MGLYMRVVIGEFLRVPFVEFTTDSRSLLPLVTSTHEPVERINKVYLAAIRDAFLNGNLNAVHCSPVQNLLADALTNENMEID